MFGSYPFGAPYFGQGPLALGEPDGPDPIPDYYIRVREDVATINVRPDVGSIRIREDVGSIEP